MFSGAWIPWSSHGWSFQRAEKHRIAWTSQIQYQTGYDPKGWKCSALDDVNVVTCFNFGTSTKDYHFRIYIYMICRFALVPKVPFHMISVPLKAHKLKKTTVTKNLICKLWVCKGPPMCTQNYVIQFSACGCKDPPSCGTWWTCAMALETQLDTPWQSDGPRDRNLLAVLKFQRATSHNGQARHWLHPFVDLGGWLQVQQGWCQSSDSCYWRSAS